MELSPGLKLGPYEVLSLVGMGGMGEVYRAKDTRIGRFVAVKVLPSRFIADESRLRRFEQEARAVGMVNHPSILALYDVGTHEGIPYVVSELLEGQTLAERLVTGALPVRKVVELGIAVAHGLAAAHEKGIVHRDLKPENVFITTDGRVKILDFGLAKLEQPVSGDGSHVPTRSGLTDAGSVVGTAGYMSPEQVRGRVVDHRSDIFSLGTILFEALTGRRAFHAESAVETMGLILTQEPPLSPEVAPGIPPVLSRIVTHCLEKSPDERFQSAKDLAFQLEALSTFSAPAVSHVSNVSVAAPAATRSVPKAAIVAAGVALLAGIGLGAALARSRAPAITAPAATEPPSLERLTFRRGIIRSARFAPDHQTVVYAASWEGEPVRLFSAHPGTPESRSLGLDGEILDLSPQGEMAILLGIGEKRYTPQRRNRVLARVALGGGAPREMMKDVLWASWSPDGKSLAVVRDTGGKTRLEYPAGTVRYETAGWVTYPRVSADGESIAFLDHPVRGDDRGDVAILDKAGRKRVLSPGWSSVKGLAFTPNGEVWFTASAAGMSRALHAATLAEKPATRTLLRMAGQLLLQDVAPDGRALLTHDSYQGSLDVLVPGAEREMDLAWLDSSGINDLSPDGQTLLFTEQGDGGGPRYSVYVRKVDGPAIRLGEGQGLAFSPDQSSALAILYGGPGFVILPTGVGEPRALPRGPIREIHWGDFTPDGASVIFLGSEAKGGARLYTQSLSAGDPRPIAPEGVTTTGHPITPDGKQIAVRSAGGALVLMPIEGGEPKPIPGAEPGDLPIRFTADGRSLFLCRGNDVPLVIQKLDLTTGRKEVWRSLAPRTAAGVQTLGPVRLTADGKGYAYNSAQFLSSLYIVKGLK